MTNPRILHCVSSLQVGGAEKCAVNLLTCQHALGYKVAVLSFGKPAEPFQSVLENRGIRVINNNESIIRRLVRTVRILKGFDVIHIHSPAVIRAFMPVFPFLMGKKVLYTHHGEDSPDQKGMRLSHWLAALYINKDFAVSEKVKLSVKQRYNWEPARTDVIPNGVLLSKGDITAPATPFKFACVARMVPLKQIDKVVTAFAQADIPQSELHLFGDGPERPAVEAAVAKHNLQHRVVLHGNVLDEDEIYRHVDCLVINSTTEGLPMALIEALARGKPAISTPVGEIPNLDKRYHFCLFSEDDTAALSEVMKTMASSPEQWEMLARNGKQLVEESYSIEQVSRTYLNAVS